MDLRVAGVGLAVAVVAMAVVAVAVVAAKAPGGQVAGRGSEHNLNPRRTPNCLPR
jgi:hypothetical protein